MMLLMKRMEQTERKKRANAIRILAMDAVEQANSGHPGMPMGMADIAEVLWQDFLSHNPANPQWPNRDRFILSNGHGCMLHYALLHLTGYDLTLADLKQFRQPHSKTPGHPEWGETPGVETTTGPLGQGLGNAVGMALAQQLLAQEYNRPEHSIIQHYIYCFVGDGCLMEGISHEVCSLAGTLGLGNLIVFYDDNQISIDGPVKNWFGDDTSKRFEAYGWQVISKVDGHDPEEIREAIKLAQTEKSRPTLIHCRTVIAWGAPNVAGSAASHGAPLGKEEIAAARQALHWDDNEPFSIPKEIYQAWDARKWGAEKEQAWQKRWTDYEATYPDLAKTLQRRWDKTLPEHWDNDWNDVLDAWCQALPIMATRQASQKTIAALLPSLTELFGGSADLSESNGTLTQLHRIIEPTVLKGNYLHFGVREFGMTAMLTGMALYGGFIPYGGTFLTFCDYARNALRLAALMRQQVILVYTHDSVALGEDGPTHQPIEHLSMLRLTPGITLWRPADAVETAVAWRQAILHREGPTALALTRQKVPGITRTLEQVNRIEKGAYIIWESNFDSAQPIQALILATGSEVSVAIDAAKQLDAQGYAIRVISMPCWERFAKQSAKYQEAIIPTSVLVRTALEAGATGLWYRWIGLNGRVVGIDQYGLSGPGSKVLNLLGITAAAVIEATLAQFHRER